MPSVLPPSIISPRRLAWLVVLFGLVGLPGRSFADEAAARVQFKKGIDLYDRKQYADALVAFQDAYKEKPSAGIKQNIALCLKGLRKPVEAATSFDEALDEGKDTLKPETRAAIERELAELSKVVATVNLAVAGEDKKPIENAVVSIDPMHEGEPPRALPPGANRRPIRLSPGLYVFTAQVPGYPSPPEKKLALVSGAPVDATFFVSDKPAVPPPDTSKRPISEAPPEYVAPENKLPERTHSFVAVGGSIDTASYRLGAPLGEPSNGTRRTGFVGGSGIVRVGYFFSKLLGVELLAGAGTMHATYRLKPSDPESDINVSHLQFTPALRFASGGKVRFTSGLGFGLNLVTAVAHLKTGGQTIRKQGGALSTSLLFDLGLQVDVGSVFVEGVVFADVHGVAPVRDEESPKDRFLLASPATRGGFRLALGVPF